MQSIRVILLLLSGSQGILLSLALLSPSKKKHASAIFLGLIFLVISLEILNIWAMQMHYHSSPQAFPFWLLISYLILPPSLWLFVQSNALAGFVFKKKYFLLYVPAFIEILVETSTHIYYRSTGVSFHLINYTPWFLFTEVFPIFWMVFVLIFYAQRLISISKRLKDFFSPPAPLHHIKLFSFFICFLLLGILWFVEVIFSQPQIFNFTEVFLVTFLFAFGYIGYFNPAFFEVPAIIKTKPAESSSFSHYDDQKELARLTERFTKEAIHRRTKLSLEELAAEINLPARYVSHLINRYHNTNFHNFVNSYRVKEVLEKIADPSQQHKTLLALAFEAGFNSKSTFNQVFKSQTGQSPSRFLS